VGSCAECRTARIEAHQHGCRSVHIPCCQRGWPPDRRHCIALDLGSVAWPYRRTPARRVARGSHHAADGAWRVAPIRTQLHLVPRVDVRYRRRRLEARGRRETHGALERSRWPSRRRSGDCPERPAVRVSDTTRRGHATARHERRRKRPSTNLGRSRCARICGLVSRRAMDCYRRQSRRSAGVVQAVNHGRRTRAPRSRLRARSRLVSLGSLPDLLGC